MSLLPAVRNNALSKKEEAPKSPHDLCDTIFKVLREDPCFTSTDILNLYFKDTGSYFRSCRDKSLKKARSNSRFCEDLYIAMAPIQILVHWTDDRLRKSENNMKLKIVEDVVEQINMYIAALHNEAALWQLRKSGMSESKAKSLMEEIKKMKPASYYEPPSYRECGDKD